MNVNPPARCDGRGGGDVHVLRVRDDRVHDDRAHDARDVRDDRGVPGGAGHLVRRGRAIYRGRGIQRAGVGTEGKVRGEGEVREGMVHDEEAEVEGKVHDEESQEGKVHGVKGEGGSANLQEGARRRHPLAGAHSE